MLAILTEVDLGWGPDGEDLLPANQQEGKQRVERDRQPDITDPETKQFYFQ